MRWLLPLVLLFAPPTLAQEFTQPIQPAMLEADTPLPPIPEGWDTVRGPFVELHGAPGDLNTLLALRDEAVRALPALSRGLGVPLGGTIHIYLAESDARFRALQPGRAPTWADGVAYPTLQLVILRAPSARAGTADPLQQVLRHELVHVLLGQAFAPTHPPSWLQEGLAQIWAGEVGPETTRTLAAGMASGNVMTLDGLARGFPDDPVRARVAYAQSAHFLGWLQQRYGDQAVRTLIRELRQGTAIEGALHAATGDFIGPLERRWRAGLESSSLAWTVLGNSDLLLGLGGVLLVVGGLARRRAFHRRLEEMEAEEAALDALIASYRAERGPA